MAYYENVEITCKIFGTTIKGQFYIQETEAGKAIATGQIGNRSQKIELKADDILTAKKKLAGNLLHQTLKKLEFSLRTIP